MKPNQARIDRAVRYMKRFLASEDSKGFNNLPTSAKMLYIVGILICNDAGFIKDAKLQAAINDDATRYAAMLVASRVGLLGPKVDLDRYA